VNEFWGFVVVISFVISEWLRHVILAKHTENSYRVLLDKSNSYRPLFEAGSGSGNNFKCFLRIYKILVLIRFTWDRKCKALMKLLFP
jgi:hypothetical protein